jgi:hypothetical protein
MQFIFYRIDTKRLQAMVQMHSYLVTNAKSELRFLDDKITSEELNETFNQIALSMSNGNELFDNNNEESNYDYNLEDYIFNDINEITNLEGINDNNLNITEFIDLSSSLFTNDISYQDYEEESIINHGNVNFDVDELISSFDLI